MTNEKHENGDRHDDRDSDSEASPGDELANLLRAYMLFVAAVLLGLQANGTIDFIGVVEWPAFPGGRPPSPGDPVATPTAITTGGEALEGIVGTAVLLVVLVAVLAFIAGPVDEDD